VLRGGQLRQLVEVDIHILAQDLGAGPDGIESDHLRNHLDPLQLVRGTRLPALQTLHDPARPEHDFLLEILPAELGLDRIALTAMIDGMIFVPSTHGLFSYFPCFVSLLDFHSISSSGSQLTKNHPDLR